MKLLRPIVTMAVVFLLAFSVSLYSVRAARGCLLYTSRCV